MKIVRAKTVAVVDPLWVGHHPMYFCQFIASFLRCGASVIGLCPDPPAAREQLRKVLDAETCSQLDSLVHLGHLPTGSRSFLNGRFEGDPIRTFLRWKHAASAVIEAEKSSGLHADLVYFPYLDSYLRFLPCSQIPGILLGRPWSGLYLRNHHHGETRSLKKSLRLLAKGDALLKSPDSLGFGVLDERFIPELKQLTGKPVTAYPDVTQADLPDSPTPLSQTIREKAAGRTIVGMIGLERRKGFLTMLRTAQQAGQNNLPFYFVFAGASNLNEFTPAECTEILDAEAAAKSGEAGNLHLDLGTGRIPCEQDYNSLFSTFQIAWAIYENFHGSSGTLSKAAEFEIPCIATAGECVGQRVERYRIGLTVTDPAQILGTLDEIAAGNPANPDFSSYRDHHSLKLLDQILLNLLEKV